MIDIIMIQARFFVLLLLLTSCSSGTTKTYYVSASGDNKKDGTTAATAWKTISKVNSKKFLPGDSILFRRGDVWRESMTITASGNSGNYITFGSYGSGNRPKIYGSVKLVKWTVFNGNIWVSATNVKDPYSIGRYAAEIFFEETTGDEDISWGHKKKSSITDCVSEYDWTWISNHIYVYSPTDPNTRYTSIEAPQRGIVINLNNKQYITIDGLDVRYSSLANIKEVYPSSKLNGLIIRNCHVAATGTRGSVVGYGLSLWHSNCLIQNNVIHDCGRRSCSFNVDNAVVITITNVTIEGNEFYHGFHTTGPDIGNTGSSTFDNFIIRNNLIWDDPKWDMRDSESVEDAVGIFIGNNNTSTGKFQNFHIYNNIIKNNPFKGIELTGTTSNVNIYNNTFYGYNPTSTEFGAQVYIASTSNGITIKNNVFYDDGLNSVNRYHPCIYMQNGASAVIDYNLYYKVDHTSPILNFAGTYTMSKWDEYKAATGNDIHSPTPADPLFVSYADLHLQNNSPAVSAGTYLGITEDFDGKPYNKDKPSLGAFEKNWLKK